jgi:spore germination cell wall hydrolase CwlJ-like protein
MIRKDLIALVAVALTVLAPGHAEARSSAEDDVAQVVGSAGSLKELNCLARNIFYEAANEPEEGKVAVGVVTLNRREDGRFGKTICAVVNQRTIFERIYRVAKTHMVKAHWWSDPAPVTTVHTETYNHAVCQFSWRCGAVPAPKKDDERWQESRRIAQELLNTDNYDDLKDRYGDALYFHAVNIRPSWAHQMEKIKRVGGHVFYKEK